MERDLFIYMSCHLFIPQVTVRLEGEAGLGVCVPVSLLVADSRLARAVLSGHQAGQVGLVTPWVNILPRIPYLAVPGFLKTLILLTGKTGIFRKKIAKTLEGGVKCFKNKGKRL